MKTIYVIAKYKGRWSVLDTVTNVYYFIGMGKKYCKNKCDDLNMYETIKDSKILEPIYKTDLWYE